jgi:hypothetical protein
VKWGRDDSDREKKIGRELFTMKASNFTTRVAREDTPDKSQFGQMAKTLAGKPDARAGLGKVQMTRAPVGGQRSKWARSSI